MSTDPSSQPATPSPSPPPAEEADGKESAQVPAAENDALTPELVEEEAIRGDFMLRWAVILLALLLGWTVVSDTFTLVRIRAGEYMAGHGVLPPRTDVFSSSAADRAWVNLGWLGDLLLAGVYNIGGAAALSLLAAIVAAVTLRFVLNTSLPGVSTWWGSFVAMLGAVACFPHLTPNSIWTLLGIALTCRLLQRFEDDPASRTLWPLVPCFWVWSNLDSLMFAGLAVLLLWAIGRTATNLGLSETRRVSLSRIWLPVAAVCVVVMIHPWHYHVWMSPWVTFGVELPEIRRYGSVTEEFHWQWYSMISTDFWQFFDLFVIFALVTAGLALLSMVLNIKEVPFEHLLWFFGINGLAVAIGVFIPAATIINTVVATLNGQAWYRRRFSQVYTVNPWALAYSRGGRALTVLAVFAVAFLTINGWLMGADGRRAGLGFDQALAANIASYEEVLSSGPDVDEVRPFNFNPEQGDLLVWLGYKPYVDRRLSVYAQQGENLLERHRTTRLAIRQNERDAWIETFREYALNVAIPRLSGGRPDYITFASLIIVEENESNDWYPVSLGAATAAFYWLNGDPAIQDFVENRQGLDPASDAFREPRGEAPTSQPFWPTAPTFTDRYVLLPDPAVPNGIQLARHYRALLDLAPGIGLGPADSLAMAYLGVRHARRGLEENPNMADGWRILSRCYLEIYAQERFLLQQFSPALPPELRLRQGIAALQLALVCDPDNPDDELNLAHLMQQTQQVDFAVMYLERYQELTGQVTNLPPDDPNYEQTVSDINEYMRLHHEALAEIEERVATGIADDISRLDIAKGLFSQPPGYSHLALQMLAEGLDEVTHPADRAFLGNLLFRNGEIEEAYLTLERIDPAFSNPSTLGPEGMQAFDDWSNLTAMANLVGGDTQRAIELWDNVSRQALIQAAVAAIKMSPLADREIEAHGAWGGFRPRLIAEAVAGQTEKWVMQQLMAAGAEIEAQQTEAAGRRLKLVIDRHPSTVFRPLLSAYILLLTGDEYAPVLSTEPVEESGSPAQVDVSTSDEPPPPPLPGEVDE